MPNRRKILVFDNDMDELSKIYIGLLLKDYLVEASTDPAEIRDRVLRFEPDIVIVNNDVPGFDGHEVCSLLKKQLNKPIILMANKSSAQPIAIDHCDADEILMKPVDVKILYHTVNRLIATWQ